MKAEGFLLVVVAASGLALAGCNATMPTVGGSSDNRVVSTQSSQEGGSALKKCSAPLGSAVLLYGSGDDPYGIAQSMAMHRQIMSQVYGFSDPVPMMKVIMQESRCFNLLNPKAKNRADYIIEIDMPVPEQTTSGIGGGLASVGSMFGVGGMIAGAVAGSVQKSEAQVILNATKRRTDEMRVYTGESSSLSLGGGIGALGLTSAGLSGVARSPRGEAAIAAMVHAHNQLAQRGGY